MRTCSKQQNLIKPLKGQHAKAKNSSPYAGELYKIRKHSLHCITRNPYLNYFRQFYAQKRGKVTGAAIEAGATWRKMNYEQKAPYFQKARNAPYIVTTRVRRLKQAALTKPGPFIIHKMLHKWTKQVYQRIINITS